MLDITVHHYGNKVDIIYPGGTIRFQGVIVGAANNSGVMHITVRITLPDERRQMSYHYRSNRGSPNLWTRVHAHGDEEYRDEGYYVISLAIGHSDPM